MMGRFDSKGLGRRAFLRNGSLVLAVAGLDLDASAVAQALGLGDEQARGGLRIGLVTDLHYADRPPAGSRYYRESLAKLTEAAERLEPEKLDFMVELGDLIDAADSVAAEQGFLKRINEKFSTLAHDRHYVLGNHCVFTLTKAEFLGGVGQERSYYGFDRGDFHFIVLDSCFRSDGTPYGRKNFEWTDSQLPAEELEWLRSDLKGAKSKRVIVFAHQRLDVSNHYGVKNAVEVQRALEESGNVLAVFQGHSHRNDYKAINGIHYCTLAAMIEGSGPENNAYSVLDVRPDGTLLVRGFRKQAGYKWPRT